MNDTTPHPDAAEFADWLHGRKNLLVLTHERPDGDAFGALAGLCFSLQANGFAARGWLREPLPRRYAFLPLPENVETAAFSPAPAAFDGVVCLDCARIDRLDLPPGWTTETLKSLPTLNLDHHADNSRFAAVNLVDPAMAASCQYLLHLLETLAWRLPAPAADWLLAGLLMDTGAFRFTNTNPDVLRAGARLVEAGAEYARVMDGLFAHEPYKRRLLAARLLERAEFHFGGRLLLTVLEPAWFAEFDVAPADSEGLIDTLRILDGVLVAALLQPEDGRVRISLRSRGETWPVDGVAHALGGGGHRLAAGIKLPGATLDEARRRLCDEVARLF